MIGFVKESREYLPEERREADVVQYRRAKVRDDKGLPISTGWSKTTFPREVADLFRKDVWHTGGAESPIHTVVTDRVTGKVIDTHRRRERFYREEPEENHP